MIRKDLPKCPFCGSDANVWEWNGGARIECSAWSTRDGAEHYAATGGRTLEEAEKKWCERFALSDDAEKMYRKLEIAEKADTIDAVPVVRCKDCKYYGNCTEHECDINGAMSSDVGYCSYGERKEDNETD